MSRMASLYSEVKSRLIGGDDDNAYSLEQYCVDPTSDDLLSARMELRSKNAKRGGHLLWNRAVHLRL